MLTAVQGKSRWNYCDIVCNSWTYLSTAGMRIAKAADDKQSGKTANTQQRESAMAARREELASAAQPIAMKSVVESSEPGDLERQCQILAHIPMHTCYGRHT